MMLIKGIVCLFKGHDIDPDESIVADTMKDKRNWLCQCHRCGLYEMHDGANSNISVMLTKREALKVKRDFERDMLEFRRRLRGDTEIDAEPFDMAIEALFDVPDTNVEKWIPITSRPMDEEERAEWSDKLGYKLDDEEAVIYGSLPDDGQMVLVCYKYGGVATDTFYEDECGCYFENNGEMDGIVAWMPLPEPWKEEKHGIISSGDPDTDDGIEIAHGAGDASD